MKESVRWTARDNGHTEEIIRHLITLEETLNISMDEEINWLQELENRFRAYKFQIGDVLKKKGKGYLFQIDNIKGGFYISNHKHGGHFHFSEEDSWEFYYRADPSTRIKTLE